MREPGERVGRYVVISLLGKGGMGEVYEAEDSLLGRRVALKLVSPDDASEDARDRMIREARATAAFEHPNAVLVLDAGFIAGEGGAGETFLAMELVRGRTLRAVMGSGEADRPRRTRWLLEAARALGAAHRRGLVHRDIKPDNLMIREDGVLKVLDFGIAKRTAAAVDPSAPTEAGQDLVTLTRAGAMVGTPKYASPEQLRGEPIDGRSDQFSWGVTAYELLTGRLPFDAPDTVSLLSQILSKDPPPPRRIDDQIPREVESAILRALSKEPDDRFASMADLAGEIEPFAEVRTGGPDVPTERTGAFSVLPPRTRKVLSRTARIAVYASAAFGAFVVIVLVVSAFTGNLRVDTGRTASASAAAATPSAVARFACSPAAVEGDARGLDLGPAVGVGACARLAIAVGVDWRPAPSAPPDAAPVEVTVALGDIHRVVIRAGGKETTGENARLIVAMREAAQALAKELAPPTCDEHRRAAWGAATAEAALRVESTWRRFVMDDIDDGFLEVRRLADEVPESAWPHAMLATQELFGSKKQRDELARALELTDKLPPARAKGVRGLLLMYRSDADKPEALRLLRQAYTDDPSDADIAGLYAAVAIALNALDEGYAVVDRVAEQSPALAIVPLRNAVGTNRHVEPGRKERYLKLLTETFPEDGSGWPAFRAALDRSDLAAAERALRFREALVGPEKLEESNGLRLALLRGDTDGALEQAKKRLASPNPQVRAQAGLFIGAAHFLSGRITEGVKATSDELLRLRDEDSKVSTLAQIFLLARLHRRLGETLPAELDEIDPMSIVEVGLASRIQIRLEIDLARKPSRAQAQKQLAALEEAAKGARREDRSSAEIALLPLVREVKGDGAAVELWRGARDVLEGYRTLVAFDAALALEAVKAPEEEIVQAYLLAMDPHRFESRPLDLVFSALRLADRYAGHPAARDARVQAVIERRQRLPKSVVQRASEVR